MCVPVAREKNHTRFGSKGSTSRLATRGKESSVGRSDVWGNVQATKRMKYLESGCFRSKKTTVYEKHPTNSMSLQLCPLSNLFQSPPDPHKKKTRHPIIPSSYHLIIPSTHLEPAVVCNVGHCFPQFEGAERLKV